MWELLSAIATISTILCAAKWIQWKVLAYAWALYIERQGFSQPDHKETKECIDAVLQDFFKY